MKKPSHGDKMRVADRIMHTDRDVLRGLPDADKQIEVTRQVMEERRGALAKLAEADRS